MNLLAANYILKMYLTNPSIHWRIVAAKIWLWGSKGDGLLSINKRFGWRGLTRGRRWRSMALLPAAPGSALMTEGRKDGSELRGSGTCLDWVLNGHAQRELSMTLYFIRQICFSPGCGWASLNRCVCVCVLEPNE